jgi:hypothetical protein
LPFQRIVELEILIFLSTGVTEDLICHQRIITGMKTIISVDSISWYGTCSLRLESFKIIIQIFNSITFFIDLQSIA